MNPVMVLKQIRTNTVQGAQRHRYWQTLSFKTIPVSGEKMFLHGGGECNRHTSLLLKYILEPGDHELLIVPLPTTSTGMCRQEM
jgi:hypothetical protein